MADWNAAQYLKFQRERTQPAIDLANHILEKPNKILDVGCGPGNSTRVLGDKFPEAYVLGVDNSENMVETARKDHPDLHFQACDASQDLHTLDQDFDLVFSNACIQWIPDHPSLVKNMLNLLKPGGLLAVQVPINFKEPIHTIISEVSSSEKWETFFPEKRIFYTLSPEEYFDLLAENARDFSLWETVYYHTLGSHQAILDWYRGTGLRPYLDALPKEKHPEFEADIFGELTKAYPLQKNGAVIFRFPRLFFTATAR